MERADLALQLYGKLAPLLAQSGQEKVFTEIESPLLPVLAAMENEGIRLDPVALEEILHGYMGCFLTLGWTAIYGECRAARGRLTSGQFTDWETFPADLGRLFEASSTEMDRVLGEGAEPGPPSP